jgi:aryl carrier-like protein
VWAETLGIDLAENPVGPDDSFLELGGDSITAMQLVGKAASVGLALSVPRIMRAPMLKQMAAAATVADEGAILERERALPQHSSSILHLTTVDLPPSVQVTPPTAVSQAASYSPFQLVASKVSVPDILATLAAKYNLDHGIVLDVYPATPLQGE